MADISKLEQQAENKMKDSDIIKALECCSGIDKCIDCPYTTINDCAKQNAKDVIDLINRQKAELADEKEKGEMCAEVIARQDKERAVIVNDRNYLLKENNKLQDQIKAAKSEAIKEFIAEFERRCIDGGIYPAFVKRQLEHVKEEMVGE